MDKVKHLLKGEEKKTSVLVLKAIHLGEVVNFALLAKYRSLL